MMDCAQPPITIAQELVDMLIDFLHADRSSLAACSLTCRAWLPAAQFHLFHKVNVEVHTFPRLLRLFETSPHIAELVQSLSVGSRTGYRELLHSSSYNNPLDQLEYMMTRRIVSKLPELTARLSSVKSLQIFGDLWTWHVLRELSTLPQVNQVDMFNLKFHKSSGLVSVLFALPALQRLSMFDGGWAIDDHPDPALRVAHRPPIALELRIISNSRHVLHLFEW